MAKTYFTWPSIIPVCQRKAEQSVHLETQPGGDILVVQTFLWKVGTYVIGRVILACSSCSWQPEQHMATHCGLDFQVAFHWGRMSHTHGKWS